MIRFTQFTETSCTVEKDGLRNTFLFYDLVFLNLVENEIKKVNYLNTKFEKKCTNKDFQTIYTIFAMILRKLDMKIKKMDFYLESYSLDPDWIVSFTFKYKVNEKFKIVEIQDPIFIDLVEIEEKEKIERNLFSIVVFCEKKRKLEKVVRSEVNEKVEKEVNEKVEKQVKKVKKVVEKKPIKTVIKITSLFSPPRIKNKIEKTKKKKYDIPIIKSLF